MSSGWPSPGMGLTAGQNPAGLLQKGPQGARSLAASGVCPTSIIPYPDGDARHGGRGAGIWSSVPDPDLKWSPLVPATATSCLLPQMTPAWHPQGTP